MMGFVYYSTWHLLQAVPPSEVVEQVPFFDLCSLLEKIGATNGTDKKKKILKTFVDQWRGAYT